MGNRNLEDVIAELLDEMRSMDPSEEVYHTSARTLQTLYAAQDVRDRNETVLEAKKLETRANWKQAVLGGATSVGSILAILHFEKFGVVASKAFGLVRMMVR